MHEAAQRVDNREQQLIFFRKRLLDREQELITVIQEETKHTEEKKKLGLDHQRGQYYEQCKRSTKPRDLSEKTDIHESKEKIRTHRASSKATRLFLTK